MCPKDVAAELHDRADIDAALADLATAKSCAGATWTAFSEALEQGADREGKG